MADLKEKYAILVSIAENGSSVKECESGLDELERLLDTAGGKTFAKIIQIKERFDPRTCIGKGKVEEISDLCEKNDISLVIFDFELSPAQIRNLENDIKNVTVIDRSMLILDIFAIHAVSGEGKLQVELAQLKYSAPRLTGKGIELSRQGGGIGSRGPGESKLETDRRHLKEKVYALEKKLEEIENNRATMRIQRDKSGIPQVAIVGYTNAGKSTLLNYLTGAGVLAENKLFATLDPTTRKLTLPCGESVLLTDTVGFIRKLPHHLVKAFKSTLDEVRYADILMIVSDINDQELDEHLEVTHKIIEELGTSDQELLYAFNKCDLNSEHKYESRENTVYISAKDGSGIDELLNLLEATVHKKKRLCKLLIPYHAQNIVSSLYNSYTVNSVDYVDGGILISVVLDSKALGKYSEYILED